MKTIHIVSGIKNLNAEFAHLQWLRLFFLSQGDKLSEDWIHHSLIIKNNRPHFQPAPNFDYMQSATESINSSDLIIFLISESSTFVLTMLRYAMYKGKKSIVICRHKRQLKGLEYGRKHSLSIYHFSDYQEKIRRNYA